jgi:hypothetical protein
VSTDNGNLDKEEFMVGKETRMNKENTAEGLERGL